LHLLLDLVLFLIFWVCLLINLRVNTYIL
jgi:hypothetical protein